MNIRIALALVALAALSRLLPHPHNFTPVGAIALFGAAYFHRQWVLLLVPFVALFLSDLAINNLIYNDLYGGGFVLFSSFWNYISFAAVVLVGYAWLSGKANAPRVFGASLSASAVFFLVSNFSVWLGSGMYPANLAGLLACYMAGIPFLGNTVMSDLFFSAALFGVYDLMARRQWAMVSNAHSP